MAIISLIRRHRFEFSPRHPRLCVSHAFHLFHQNSYASLTHRPYTYGKFWNINQVWRKMRDGFLKKKGNGCHNSTDGKNLFIRTIRNPGSTQWPTEVIHTRLPLLFIFDTYNLPIELVCLTREFFGSVLGSHALRRLCLFVLLLPLLISRIVLQMICVSDFTLLYKLQFDWGLSYRLQLENAHPHSYFSKVLPNFLKRKTGFQRNASCLVYPKFHSLKNVFY